MLFIPNQRQNVSTAEQSTDAWCTGLMIFSFHKEDRMLPTAGLHTSQPIESGLTPTAAMTSGIVFNFLNLLRDEHPLRAHTVTLT